MSGATDSSGITDSVDVELTDDPTTITGPNPDAKGPSEEEWAPEVVAARTNEGFVAEGDIETQVTVGYEEEVEGKAKPITETVMVKGPATEQWGAEARAERGATVDG